MKTPGVVHTIQLVVNVIEKDPAIQKVLDRLPIIHCHKHVTAKMWTHPDHGLSNLVARHLFDDAFEVKDHFASVAESMTWDCLQTSE